MRPHFKTALGNTAYAQYTRTEGDRLYPELMHVKLTPMDAAFISRDLYERRGDSTVAVVVRLKRTLTLTLAADTAIKPYVAELAAALEAEMNELAGQARYPVSVGT
jgi:hypothetical protein